MRDLIFHESVFCIMYEQKDRSLIVHPLTAYFYTNLTIFSVSIDRRNNCIYSYKWTRDYQREGGSIRLNFNFLSCEHLIDNLWLLYWYFITYSMFPLELLQKTKNITFLKKKNILYIYQLLKIPKVKIC